MSGIGDVDQRDGERDYPRGRPEETDVWSVEAKGEDRVALDVPLGDEQMQIVAMPASPDGERPEVGVGYQVPGGFLAGLVAAGIGLLLALVCLRWGRRRTPRGAAADPTSEDRSVEQEQEREVGEGRKAASARTARRVVALGSAAVLTGCGAVPHTVDHGEPSVVPLTKDESVAVMERYSVENEKPGDASDAGDGSTWSTVDVGPTLLVDELATRAAQHTEDQGTDWTGTHSVDGVYVAEQGDYPLWAIVHGTETWSAEGEDDVVSPNAWVMVRTGAEGGWRQFAGAELGDDALPEPLSPDEATADEADLKRAAAVSGQVEKWFETGKADLEVPGSIQERRGAMLEPGKNQRSTAAFITSWPDGGKAAPGGSLRALRVEGGLLVHLVQGLTLRGDLKSGWRYLPDERYRAIYGEDGSEGYLEAHGAASSLVFVPDEGPAQMLGMDASRIRELPPA
ncbi:hypothetical protein GCM10022199_16160 [Marihabitans asiaticum]|uniref:Uncharacterized protein n=1 Tax=Marihabitans asiaticum TaxID=415218 RepID=A0A560W7S9_9MICO|nr:hypothetical protein [Marihabitans asiaticum]TWD13696.1 hypothetical protein FB557_2326 [Marihabitans asiaticum]